MNNRLRKGPQFGTWMRSNPCLTGLLCTLMFMLVASGAAAQIPGMSVRFANPQYNCGSGTYCLDVEFQSDTPNLQIRAIRFTQVTPAYCV